MSNTNGFETPPITNPQRHLDGGSSSVERGQPPDAGRITSSCPLQHAVATSGLLYILEARPEHRDPRQHFVPAEHSLVERQRDPRLPPPITTGISPGDHLLITCSSSGPMLSGSTNLTSNTPHSVAQSYTQAFQRAAQISRAPVVEDPDENPELPGRNSSNNMQFTTPDLAILSAEQYDDGRQPRKRPRKSPPVGAEGGPKRRGKTRATVTTTAVDMEQEEADEEVKRPRGRPRLENTEETPQERRRTQIRLAQRAYRNRKESAITNLEKENEGLRDANTAMSQAYHDLFEYASRHGLLDTTPEFGQRLRNLESLIKRSGDQGGNADKSTTETESDAVTQRSQRRRKASHSQQAQNLHQASQQPQSQQPKQLWAGLMLSQDPNAGEISHFSSPIDNLTAPQQEAAPMYEIIAQPTPANASFAAPFGAGQPQFTTPSMQSAGWSAPWHPLQSPASFAYMETTFGRRLHRTALQRAARLISMPNPPPDRIMRVFGFVRLFETYEEIKERTVAQATRTTTDDPLSYWRHPFHHLGGAGTHFPGAHSAEPLNRPPNPPNNFPPKGMDPFPIGPPEPKFAQARDSLLVMGREIKIPGWQGVYWDPNEVEFYLMQNNVHIPPTSDHCIVEVEDAAFGPPPANADLIVGSLGRAAPAASSSAGSVSGVSLGIDSAINIQTTSSPPSSTHLSSPRERTQAQTSAAPSMAANTGWQAPGSSSGDFSLLQPPASGAPGLLAFDSNAGLDIPGGSAGPVDPALGFTPSVGEQGMFAGGPDQGSQTNQVRKRLWKIDIERFMDQLCSRCTCLGRTPGFRPKDVDAAFWASVQPLLP